MMIITSTDAMKSGCELCNCATEDATSFSFASPKDVLLWSKDMLRIDSAVSISAPHLIVCSDCVFKISDVGQLLWQWKDRIVYAGRWEILAGEEKPLKREPSYDPFFPYYDEDVQREEITGEAEMQEDSGEKISKGTPRTESDMGVGRCSTKSQCSENGGSTSTISEVDSTNKMTKKRRGRPPKLKDSKVVIPSNSKERELGVKALVSSPEGKLEDGSDADTLQSSLDATKGSCVAKARSEQFVCADCGKVFTRERALISHATIHTGERPFKCEACGKTFRQKYSLDLHKFTVHSDERPFTCDVCGKTFKLRMKLDDHKRTHTGVKPHSCDTCGARFANRSDVTKHMRFHTGEKPFQCSTCDKTFYTSSNLRTHETIHKGSKPFHCQFCGKSFGRKGNLLEHCRGVHLDEKPFKCLVCGQGFRRKKMMSEHQLSCRLDVTKHRDHPSVGPPPSETEPSEPLAPSYSSTTTSVSQAFVTSAAQTSSCGYLSRSNIDSKTVSQK